MQTGVLATQIVGLEGLDRLNGSRAHKVGLLRDTGQHLESIHQSRCCCTQQRGPVWPVMTVPSLSSMAAAGAPPVALAAGVCLLFHFALAHGQVGLIHQQFQLVALGLLTVPVIFCSHRHLK